MSSALKPALPQGGNQNPSVSPQLNKPVHPQSTPTQYGQPGSHLPQNLVNIPHSTVPTNAHSTPHHTNAHQGNYFSLNVPNAPQHYSASQAIPVSNHPVASVSQSSAGQQQTYSPSKSTIYTSGGYQSNLGHPPNVIPPVSQSLPPTQPNIESGDKPQANGTPEVKITPKIPEMQQNHVATVKEHPSPVKEHPSPVKEKTPVPLAPQPEKVSSPEKVFSQEPKPAENKPVEVPVNLPAVPVVGGNVVTTPASTNEAESASPKVVVTNSSTGSAPVAPVVAVQEEKKAEAVSQGVVQAPATVTVPKSKEQVRNCLFFCVFFSNDLFKLNTMHYK